jgi:hypothetical protein
MTLLSVASVRRRNHDGRHARAVKHVVRDAAEHAPQRAVAAGSDDDLFRAARLGDLEDRGTRRSLEQLRLVVGLAQRVASFASSSSNARPWL